MGIQKELHELRILSGKLSENPTVAVDKKGGRTHIKKGAGFTIKFHDSGKSYTGVIANEPKGPTKKDTYKFVAEIRSFENNYESVELSEQAIDVVIFRSSPGELHRIIMLIIRKMGQTDDLKDLVKKMQSIAKIVANRAFGGIIKTRSRVAKRRGA